MYRFRVIALAVLLSSGLLAGCEQMMAHQPKYTPLSASTFFANGQSARPLIPDTVARGHVRANTGYFVGVAAGREVTSFPYPVTMALLQRGRERFNIYCAPCHDQTGNGNGRIVERGFPHPPSFHDERLRTAPIGHFVDVIANGYGVMFPYNDRVEPADRWAIAAYIRALQLSQSGTLSDVSAPERAKLMSMKP